VLGAIDVGDRMTTTSSFRSIGAAFIVTSMI